MKQIESWPPAAHTTAARLTNYLRQYEARYPQAWDAIAWFRRQRRALGDWPDWCFCPLAAAMAIVTGGDELTDPAQITEACALGALAAWRTTQTIYRERDARPTRLTQTLDVAALLQLPAWGVYLLTPRASFGGRPLHGAFAHLEFDVKFRRPELRLLLDADDAHGRPDLTPIPIFLDQPTLASALHAFFTLGAAFAKRGAHAAGAEEPVQAAIAAGEWFGVLAQTIGQLAPLVAALERLAREVARGEPVVAAAGEAAAARPTLWEF